MKKTFWLFLIVPFLFVSCFDFVEELTIEKDGTGKAKYKMNLSQSKVKLESLMLLDSVRGYKVPSKDDIHEKLQELKSELTKQAGLKNVQVKENWGDYIFEVTFAFDSVEAINRGVKAIADNEPKAKKYFFDPFSYTSKKFERNYKGEDLSKMGSARSKNLDILKEAQYIGIYRFNKSVVSQKNTKYKVSKGRNAVMFKSTLLDLIDQKVTLQNTVTLK